MPQAVALPGASKGALRRLRGPFVWPFTVSYQQVTGVRSPGPFLRSSGRARGSYGGSPLVAASLKTVALYARSLAGERAGLR